MIKGKIEDGLHPIILVEIAGSREIKEFPTLVDTGFDCDLALHRSEAEKLGLEITDFVFVDYADGKREREPLCPARISWHGKWKEIEVVLSHDEEPAIGTRLLQGSIMTMDFVKNTLAIRKPFRLISKRR